MAYYICTGTCGSVVTEDEYDTGARLCASRGCSMEGQELERHEGDLDRSHA